MRCWSFCFAFAEDIDSGVICRWSGPDGLVLDAVPADTRLSGMKNEWLQDAVSQPASWTLPSGTTIRLVAPQWLLVLKLVAFADRGKDDPLESRDFEDIALLVDGRHEVLEEARHLPPEARSYVGGQVSRVMALPDFDYGLEGALPGVDARARAHEVTLPRFAVLADVG